ncbi:hypothetical protein NP493_1167g00007 [Ridgeia piscesae]|uniref:Uncharacterized protein n=1 Tax=Ridgeia piscesae TaxID=27915 RepID=A0AAD9NH24_RIDPI|nr:hypothetical protein NP493_1167g00007 [Ridgeia piscesae]
MTSIDKAFSERVWGGLQAIHYAAKAGKVEASRMLLENGADVNATTKKGSTPLHIATLAGKPEVVKLLLKEDADVNMLSKYKDDVFSPLYMAAQIGHQEIVVLLLAHGADHTHQTANGATSRDVALQQGHTVVAQLLEEYEKRRSERLVEDCIPVIRPPLYDHVIPSPSRSPIPSQSGSRRQSVDSQCTTRENGPGTVA